MVGKETLVPIVLVVWFPFSYLPFIISLSSLWYNDDCGLDLLVMVLRGEERHRKVVKPRSDT